MKIKSKEFNHGEFIPKKFSCNGENINPELEFIDIPEGTKSLVMIMDDPDVPEVGRKDRMFDHWIVFNISPDKNILEENFVPKNEKIGINTAGDNFYRGPCPPDTLHRYFFKLYALDKILDLKNGVSKEDVYKAMKGGILERAELIGIYEQEESLKTIKNR